MPPELNGLGEKVALDNLRSLGGDGVADYWVSVSSDSKVCLVGYIPGEYWVAGSSCASVVEFYQRGVGLGLGQNTENANEAYLLPADVDVAQLALPVGVSMISTVEESGAVVFSRRASGPRIEPALIQRENGVVFRFSQFVGPAR